MYRHGLFAFSGDPITYGHMHLIERIAKKCERLTVVIATSDTKTPLFSIQERYELAKLAIKNSGIGNVEVTLSQDVLGNIFLDLGCDVLFRGIRGDKDRMEERELIGTYIAVWPFLRDRIEIVEAEDGFRHISSTMARVCAARYLPLEGLVPLHVKRALEERVVSQFKLGVTGRMATGKTWLAQSLATAAECLGIPSSVIHFDELIVKAYEADTPGGQTLRKQIGAFFRDSVVTEAGVDRKKLSERLFDPQLTSEAFEHFVSLTKPYVEREYQRALVGKKGLIIIEWSQLVEMNMLSMVNNMVIHVQAEKDDHAVFVRKRGINQQVLTARLARQKNPDEVAHILDEQMSKSGAGYVFPFINAYAPLLIDEMFKKDILPHFPRLNEVQR